ncbi:MAG: metallophosphoesterase, partial [Candidatus Kariarchaeaceae archaeon]
MKSKDSSIPPFYPYRIDDNLTIIAGTPFLYIAKYELLVFGDIHFGQETAIGLLEKNDSSTEPVLAEYLLDSISKIDQQMKIKTLILNGDIKHETYSSNGQERISLKYFLDDSRVSKYEIILIKGNHDLLLHRSIKQIKHSKVKLINYFCKPPFCIFHGHEDYSQSGCEYVILSHEHPSYNFRGNNFEKMRTMAFVLMKSQRDEVIFLLPPSNFISSGVVFPIVNAENFLSPYLRNNADISVQHIFPFSDEI